MPLPVMDYHTAATTYDQQARVYHFTYGGHEIDVIDFMEKLKVQASDSILDLGTGTGLVANYALDAGCNFVVGIDASQQCLDRAERSALHHIEATPDRFRFRQADMTDLAQLRQVLSGCACPPSVDGTKFDKIAILWAWDHVDPSKQEGWLRMLKEHFLKPNGVIVLTKDDPQVHMQTIEVITGWHNPKYSIMNAPIETHLKRWVGSRTAFLRARNEVRALALRVGLTVMETTPCPHLEKGEYQDFTAQVMAQVNQIRPQFPGESEEILKERARKIMLDNLAAEYLATVPAGQRVRVNQYGDPEHIHARAQHKVAGALLVLQNQG